MKRYKQMKFMMKITFEAWRRQIEKGTLVHYALLKAMQKRLAESTKALKSIVYDQRLNQ